MKEVELKSVIQECQMQELNAEEQHLLELAIKAGSVNRSDAAILAARITGYGIDTPPEPGPSLAIYDQVFLPSKDNGKEALAS